MRFSAAATFVTLSAFIMSMSLPVSADVELPGVLINQTRSVAGQAFYSGFYQYWQARDPEGIYSLVINEKPMPQSVGSSLMSVMYDDTVVFRRAIIFNNSKAEKAGQDATEYVFSRVVQVEADREIKNPDMAQSGF